MTTSKALSGIENVYVKGGRVFPGGGKVTISTQVTERSSDTLFQTNLVREAVKKLSQRNIYLRVSLVCNGCIINQCMGRV
jgi:hypothetical protein